MGDIKRYTEWNQEESIRRNLQDAGCSEEFIQKFLEIGEKEPPDRKKRMLNQHRSHLLDNLHREQKRIDCLDYLIYQFDKQQNTLI